MRVLLTSNASYAPPKGGSTRSNLAWLRAMARNGHACEVVCPPAVAADAGAVEDNGVTIHRVDNLSHHPAALSGRIAAFQPDWVLVSSEDLSHVLLREASRAAAGRIVCLAHTPQFFPFGPESWNPDERATERVRKSAAIVAIGRHMAGYIRKHAGRDAHVVHPPIYGEPPFPDFGAFAGGLARGRILLINPSIVKGISIFLGLAERFPTVRFAGLCGWGTTSSDRAAMARLPNVEILESVPNIEDVLRRANCLLMPSLWYEGFGLIAMEAMLRGLPVISSDSGGLMEAKEGTGFIIPVRPVERYETRFDENHMPVPVTGEQNLEPWAAALQKLLTDRTVYEEEARRSREAGLKFVSGVRGSGLEDLLKSLPSPQPTQVPAAAEHDAPHPEALSPARRALLLKRLRERSGRE